MQSEGSLPEEHPGRRPPPSTSSPYPAWFFRLHSPLFRRSETAIHERFAPLQLLAFVQLAQERSPDLQPDLLLLPVPQSPPAGRRRRKLLGQITPASPAAQNPQNAFQHSAVGGRRSSAVRAFPPFREQGPDLLPLGVGQQPTVSRHRPSLGAAHYAYRAFWENQLLQNQNSVPSFETASNLNPRSRSESKEICAPHLRHALSKAGIEPTSEA